MSRLGFDRIGVALCAAACAVACGVSAQERPRPDVLLFVVDSPGEPSLTCQATWNQAPAPLPKLAESGVVIAELTSARQARRPELTTILTGRRDAGAGEPLPALAQAFGAAGYRTLAVVQGQELPQLGGFEQTLASGARGDEFARVVGQALQEPRDSRPDAPLFLLVVLAPGARGLADAGLDAVLEHLAEQDPERGVVHALALASCAPAPAQKAATGSTPLILWGDGIPAGQRFQHVADGVDLYPTLLEAGRIAPPSELSGRSLLALVGGAPEGWGRHVFALGEECVSVRNVESGFELVVPTGAAAQAGGQFELYDACAGAGRREGPDRRENLAAARTDQVVQLLGAFDAWVTEHGAPAGVGALPDTRRMLAQQLESLGYTSFGVEEPAK